MVEEGSAGRVSAAEAAWVGFGSRVRADAPVEEDRDPWAVGIAEEVLHQAAAAEVPCPAAAE